MRDKDLGTRSRNAVFGALNQAVHFRMNRPHAVTIKHLVTNVITVGLARNRAIIASANNALVLYQNAAHQGPVAGWPLRNHQGLQHEVLFPRNAIVCHLLPLKVIQANSIPNFSQSLVGNFIGLLGASQEHFINAVRILSKFSPPFSNWGQFCF